MEICYQSQLASFMICFSGSFHHHMPLGIFQIFQFSQRQLALSLQGALCKLTFCTQHKMGLKTFWICNTNPYTIGTALYNTVELGDKELLVLNAKFSLSLCSKLTFGLGKWFLNTNLFLIKTFLITKFDCTI